MTPAERAKQVAEMPHVKRWLKRFAAVARDMPPEVWVFCGGTGGATVLAKAENLLPCRICGPSGDEAVDTDAVILDADGGTWDGGDW